MKSTFNFTFKQASSAVNNRATEIMNCHNFTFDKLVGNHLSLQGNDNCNVQAASLMLHGSITTKNQCTLVN